METVTFTQMADGTAADYALLTRIEDEEIKTFPDRVLGWLQTMHDSAGDTASPGWSTASRLRPAPTAPARTRKPSCARCCTTSATIWLLRNHSEVAAAVLRPYVSEKNYWIVKHHGVFQGVYYFHHVGQDPNARERWRDHPYFQATADFCAHYDQNSFDPDYPWEPLEFFVPMVRRVLSEPHRTPHFPEQQVGEAGFES